MKLILAKPRGFCAGVVRAIETVEKALKLFGSPLYVKHEIVHNRHVVEALRKKGIIFIEDLEEVPIGERVIYSAHGVSPKVKEHAKRRNLIDIDATCCLVTKVHQSVASYYSMGYKIILIGKKKHVEILGTAGHAPNATTIVSTLEDVEKLNFLPTEKLFYITQTTLSIDDVKTITDALKEKYPNIETIKGSSICFATTNHQQALKEMTKNNVDLVLIVGDPNSSNSNRLKEVGKKRNIPSYLINAPEEIDPSWLKNVQTIGMSSGASTPETVVQACVAHLQTLGVNEVEEIEYKQENVSFALPQPLRSYK